MKYMKMAAVAAMLGACVPILAAEAPVAWWTFDPGPAPSAWIRDGKVGGTRQLGGGSGYLKAGDLVHGHFRRVPGVVGDALLFDGFTTRVIRPAASVPPLTGGWSV